MGGGWASHEISPDNRTNVWLTPPGIVHALCMPPHGLFDLDPCAAIDQPWWTAERHYTEDDDGLAQPWFGTVWMNPPYGRQTAVWLARLADHGDGVALVFARTDTDMFDRYVWRQATALLFLKRRINFYRADGSSTGNNAGAPSVLVAYGEAAADRLRRADIRGAFVSGWGRI